VSAAFDPATERARAERARDELPGSVQAFAEAYQAIVLDALAPSAR
jgi:hypothetical protein